MTYEEISKRRKGGEKAVFVFGAGMEMGNDIGLCSSMYLPASILSYMNRKESTIDVLKKRSKTESFKAIVQKRLNNLFQNKEKLSELLKKIGTEKYSDSDFAKLLSYVNSEMDIFFLSDESTKNVKDQRNKKLTDVEQSYAKLRQTYSKLPNVSPDFLIDADKLAISHNWTKILSGLVDTYGDVVEENGEPESKDAKCLRDILGWVVDYDSLLTESYIGFYTKKKTLKNRYMYLSWLLWSYLANIDRKKDVDDTIYSKVADKCIRECDSVITLNYSTFVDPALKKNGKSCCIHFHGDLAHFIKERDEDRIEDYDNFSKNTSVILSKVFEKGDVIPSMMPPLDIKPLISKEYLGRWLEAKKEIDDATQIFVVGYSFSPSDEHFNELLYNAKGKENKEIYIVCNGFRNQTELEKKFSDYKTCKPITCEAKDFFEYKMDNKQNGTLLQPSGL